MQGKWELCWEEVRPSVNPRFQEVTAKTQSSSRRARHGLHLWFVLLKI